MNQKRVLGILAAVLAGFLQIGAATAGPGQPVPAGATYEVGFSGDNTAQALILRAINSARENIVMAAYTFTSKDVTLALQAAQKRGVPVYLVVDADEAKKAYSSAQFLANNGVQVRTNDNFAIMHHKFMVIDRRHVQTGSYNYSKAAASKNAENVLVLWDVPDLATAYGQEWMKLWGHGQPVKSNY